MIKDCIIYKGTFIISFDLKYEIPQDYHMEVLDLMCSVEENFRLNVSCNRGNFEQKAEAHGLSISVNEIKSKYHVTLAQLTITLNNVPADAEFINNLQFYKQIDGDLFYWKGTMWIKFYPNLEEVKQLGLKPFDILEYIRNAVEKI